MQLEKKKKKKNKIIKKEKKKKTEKLKGLMNMQMIIKRIFLNSWIVSEKNCWIVS